MDRNEVLRRGFDAIYWQEDEFEIGSGDLHRLANSIASSVEKIAAHSLNRVHKWIWPSLADRKAGDRFAVGDLSFEVVEDQPLEPWEGSRKGVVVHANGKTWKLVWLGMEGSDPTIGVAVSSAASWNGFEPAAYCELPASQDGGYRGGLNATGDDVGRMFDLFSALRTHMPPDLLVVKDGSKNDWFLDEAEDILELDGGLGGSAATELHAMAEQHAASVVFTWAGPRYQHVARLLGEHQDSFGVRGFKHADGDRIVSQLERGDDGVTLVLDSRFPHKELFDRYLTLLTTDAGGEVQAVSSYAIPEGEALSECLNLLRAGLIEPTVSYDYRSGSATFAPGKDGTLHIAHIATALHATEHLCNEIAPESEGVVFEVLHDGDLEEITSPAAGW